MMGMPDLGLLRRLLVGFLRNEITKVGWRNAVLGISGGVDSSLCAYLAAEALGPSHVLGVMMPYQTSSPESLAHAEQVVRTLAIRHLTVDITPMIDAYFARFPQADPIRRGNKMARERMSILYDQSAAERALVLGTSNKSELLLGYGTLYGDMASAINPLGDLYKSHVWALAEFVGVPEEIVRKRPSADLWQGQSDEEELGFAYSQVDEILFLLVDRRYTCQDLTERGYNADFVRHVHQRIQSTQYKRRLPVIAKVSHRTIDRDFRYSRDWGL